MTCWIITGTDTEIGKTMTTAALAALLTARGRTVAIHKPAQTGMAGPAGTGGPSPETEGDAEQARRLSGAGSASEGVRLRDPLAPVRAAAREGRALPTPAAHLRQILDLLGSADEVIIEGAGGLLVEIAPGWDIGDLAEALARRADGETIRVIVTVRAGLGTLNHTGLTLRELRRRGITVPTGPGRPGTAQLAGIVIGSWPEEPDLARITNRTDLLELAPVLGVLPEGIGALDAPELQRRAGDLLPGILALLEQADGQG